MYSESFGRGVAGRAAQREKNKKQGIPGICEMRCAERNETTKARAGVSLW